jgi:Ca-activated chloride channel family protein
LAVLVAAAAPAIAQQDDKDRDQSSVNEVVVTATMRVRQGGAQDINHFRGEAAAQRIPFPDDLTAEGLMGGYDLQLGVGQPCAQVFCINGESMRASLAGRPDDRILVGLGFGTNIDAAHWDRQPLNLVAVVDKSGSMDGEPLGRVRASLHQILKQLRPGDQISIVLYGDRSYRHLEPTRVNLINKAWIDAKIDAIASNGSPDMESGLQVGYETAFESQKGFKGVTRVMLFTDEQPNVGATDADTFMGMAMAASQRGVGLTTIGVGEQFDGALATRISSVRGGNLFFLNSDEDVKGVFGVKLDAMVSELAYDVTVTIHPRDGYRISGVFGVPGEALEKDGEDGVRLVVPTAFFSTNGGGIFVALAPSSATAYLPEAPMAAGSSLLKADLTYVSALDGRPGASQVTVAAPDGVPSANLKLGGVLIGEFLTLKDASTKFHVDHDPEGAYQTLRQLASTLGQAGDPRLKPEVELVGNLVTQTAMLSGHGNEAGPVKLPALAALTGAWSVVDVAGDIDLRRGDRLELGDDNSAHVVHKTPIKTTENDEYDTYKVNDHQLLLVDSNVMYAWQLSGSLLTLYDDRHEVTLRLRRAPAEASD